MFHFALNIGGISAQSHMLLFVICFSCLILLLHCNAVHFDSFSLDSSFVSKVSVIFFNAKLYLCTLLFSELKSLSELLIKGM
jgi:hypothetical protein